MQEVTFNGFVGQGSTVAEAEVAAAYAAAHLPLDGSDEEKTISYEDIPASWKEKKAA